MNTNDKVNLNELVDRFYQLKKEISNDSSDPILRDIYMNDLNLLKSKYGSYLNEILFDLHDDYCEDDSIEGIENYISEYGVDVEAEDYPGVNAKLFLRANPLRFVATDPNLQNEITLWRAA